VSALALPRRPPPPPPAAARRRRPAPHRLTARPPAVNRARPLLNLGDKKPEVGPGAFVAPTASLVGDVRLGAHASVFYGAVLRGDAGAVTVGERSNIQDGCVIRTGAGGLGERDADARIGARVTVGHQAVLHGCTVEDEALVGMGATLLAGSTVERGAMVAAGAVLAPGACVPAGEIWGGNPARLLRALKPNEAAFLAESAEHYVALSAEHLRDAARTLEEVARAKGLAKV
jgi:carbonic anhydrase/acetyltransferase-like protein (isoleucine patch superfamily)